LTPSISITPSVTPSSTPVSNIIYWSFNREISGTSFAIYRNGTLMGSSTAIAASGQFTHTPGNSIEAITNESVKVNDWTQTCVTFGGSVILSDKQEDSQTSVTFTTGAGSYQVTGQESTSQMAACTGGGPPPPEA
jgi:hypothetical protein